MITSHLGECLTLCVALFHRQTHGLQASITCLCLKLRERPSIWGAKLMTDNEFMAASQPLMMIIQHTPNMARQHDRFPAAESNTAAALAYTSTICRSRQHGTTGTCVLQVYKYFMLPAACTIPSVPRRHLTRCKPLPKCVTTITSDQPGNSHLQDHHKHHA